MEKVIVLYLFLIDDTKFYTHRNPVMLGKSEIEMIVIMKQQDYRFVVVSKLLVFYKNCS